MPKISREKLSYTPKRNRQRRTTERDNFLKSAPWTKTSKKYRNAHPVCEVHQHYDRVWRKRLEVDHVIPRSQGGAKLDHDNLMTLCKECHDMKSGWETHYGALIGAKENKDGDMIPEDRTQIYELFKHLF